MKFPFKTKLELAFDLFGGICRTCSDTGLSFPANDSDILASTDSLDLEPQTEKEEIKPPELDNVDTDTPPTKNDIADKFLAAKAKENNPTTPSARSSNEPGTGDTFTSSSLNGTDIGTLRVSEDVFSSSNSPPSEDSPFYRGDTEKIDWSTASYSAADVDLSFLSLERPEQIDERIVDKVLDETGETFVYSPDIIEARERLAAAKSNGTLDQELAILNNTDRESLSEEDRLYVDNFNKLYDDASGLTRVIEANNIWDSVSIKVADTPKVISDMPSPGIGVKDGDLIASADIGTTKELINQASYDFTRSAWKYYNLKDLYTNDNIDFSKHENLKLDDNFTEYLELSKRLNSEESINSYYTGKNAQAKLNADFKRFMELDGLHVPDINNFEFKGDNIAKKIGEGQASATAGISATRENILKSIDIFKNRTSEALGQKAKNDKITRDQLEKKGASKKELRVFDERIRAREEAKARLDSMTEEEQQQFCERVYSEIEKLKNSSDPDERKFGEQLERDYKNFEQTGEISDNIVAYITEKAATDQNSKLSKTAKYVLTDSDVLLKIFKEDPEKYKDVSLKEFITEKFGRDGSRSFDQITEDLNLSSYEVEKINHNDARIQQIKVKYNYQASQNYRNNTHYRSSRNTPTVSQQIQEARTAMVNNSTPTQAGHLTPSQKAKVSRVMNETGLPYNLAKLVALEGMPLAELKEHIEQRYDESVLPSTGLEAEINNFELAIGKSLDDNETRLSKNSGLNNPLTLNNDSFLGIQFG